MWFLLPLGIAALLTALMLLPIRLTVDIYHAERTFSRIGLQAARLGRAWLFEAVRTAQGHQLIVAGQDGVSHGVEPGQLRGSPADHMLSALRRADKARHFLIRHIHPERLDASLLLHTENAAATALLTGAMRTLTGCLPLHWREKMHVRIQPDFFREHTTIQARCILRFRLGTIIITACMLLAAIAVQRAYTAREA